VLHARLRLPSSPGAADCLVGRAFPEDAVLPTAFDNLDFLPAGSNLGNPTTLFSENRFAQMLERLRERYEFVIVDTPPVLAFGEAIVAALAVDGAVLCALRDRSHATAVAKARARLQAAGVRLLTAVLNNAPSSHSTNSYYYRRAAENGLPAVRAGQRA
jgi:capsular exopolysaccharide synthesis family protein